MWPVLSLISAFSASSINYIDKYLLEKHLKDQSVGSLVIVSAIVGAPLALLVGSIWPSVTNISTNTALLIILNGALYVAWLIPYLKALFRDDTSTVIPLFQLYPVISYFLGMVLLNETISSAQIIGSLLIISGSLALTLDIQPGRKIVFKKELLFLVLLSSFLLALNSVLIKKFAIQTDFQTTVFWEYIGFFFAAVSLFIFHTTYRKEFILLLKNNSQKILGISLVNELLAAISKTTLNFAFLLAPVSMVSVLAEGTTPVITLILGLALTKIAPNFIQENTEKKHLAKKIVAIAIILVGTMFTVDL